MNGDVIRQHCSVRLGDYAAPLAKKREVMERALSGGVERSLSLPADDVLDERSVGVKAPFLAVCSFSQQVDGITCCMVGRKGMPWAP